MESTIAAAAAAALPINRALRIADSMEKKHENKNGRTLSKEEEEKKSSICKCVQAEAEVCSVQRAHQTEMADDLSPAAAAAATKSP